MVVDQRLVDAGRATGAADRPQVLPAEVAAVLMRVLGNEGGAAADEGSLTVAEVVRSGRSVKAGGAVATLTACVAWGVCTGLVLPSWMVRGLASSRNRRVWSCYPAG